jgi:hypothetical protein
VNAELTIGPMTEMVAVVQEEPATDVQSTSHEASMTEAIVSTIPTGRSLTNLGVLIPGMNTWSARAQSDVGGTNNLQNIFMAVHGGRVSDQRVYLDGINLRNLQSEGHAINFTPDMSSAAEVTITYAAMTAEESTGGVRANYIPRDGANIFQLSVFATGANGAFQGSNTSDGLRNRGFGSPDTLKRTYDVNAAAGGPIVRGRLWFFSAVRAQSNQNFVGGIFENRNAGNPSAWTYDPDPARQGVFAIRQTSSNVRLTWQPTPTHKIGLFVEKQWRTWDEGNVNRAPEAFSRFRFPANQIAVVSWSAPLSSRVLIEARAAYHAESWRNIGADDLLGNNRSLIPVLEQGGAFPGLMYRAKNGTYAAQAAPFITVGHSSLSYVTGTHTIKTGVDLVSGTNTNANTFNDSGLQYRFNNGVPNQITEIAAPYDLAWRMTEVGAFAQDRWRLNRLTLNTGLRFDFFGTDFPEQHLGPATLWPDRNLTFAETSWYRLKDLSPRFGAALDLSGNGKTIVKGTAGRYVVALSPATGNPIANLPLSVNRMWDDENADYHPDCDILNPLANGECGMVSDLGFSGARPTVRYDPAILRGWSVRPVNWEYSAAVQQELRHRITMSAAYFRRAYSNFTVQDNLATSAIDYTAFSVVAPQDRRLPDGGGYTVGGLYDLSPDKRGQVDNFVTAASRYGRWSEHWNGADVTISLRSQHAMLEGGVSTGRTSSDMCQVVSQIPELLGSASNVVGGRAIPWSSEQCHIATRFQTQAKWMGSYNVPRIDVRLAGAYQSTPGIELQAMYVAPNAAVQPSLGRPLSGSVNAPVTLLTPGKFYGDRINQLDVRVTKLLRYGKARTALNFDIYNAFNTSAVTAANLNYSGDGAQWLRPQGILPPRLFKISAQISY